MNEKMIHRLEEILEEYIERENIPGMAAGIVSDERVFTRGFGVRKNDTCEKVNGETIFHMASVSKTMLSTAMMRLAERGIVHLDFPISAYLPYFRIEGGKEKEITIRRALSHSSGLTYTDDSEWDKGVDDDGALERYSRSLTHVRRLLEPDQQFYYNNTLYDVLGDVISKVYGSSFETAVEELALRPLKMKRSTFLKAGVPDDNIASPHVLAIKNGKAMTVSSMYPYNRMHAPCSSLHSCAEDLVKYIHFYVQGKEDFLKKETVDELMRPVQQVTKEPDVWMGLGWFLSMYKGEFIHYHSGSDTGFNTKLIVMPGRKAGAVFMCNADYVDVDQLSTMFLRFLSGEELAPIIPSGLGDVIRAVREDEPLGDSLEKMMTGREEVSVIKDVSRLMHLLLEEKKVKEAKEVLCHAWERFGKDAQLLSLEAELLKESGDEQGAKQAYEAVLSVNPGNYDAFRGVTTMI